MVSAISIEALKEMMPLYREGISLAFDKVTKKEDSYEVINLLNGRPLSLFR